MDKGVPTPKILVSDRAQIVMSYHILFDECEEERLGKKSFGSTKSGIAPFYSDKYAKIGFQVCELFDEEFLKDKVARVLEQKNVILEHLYHKPALKVEDILEELHTYRDMVAPLRMRHFHFSVERTERGQEDPPRGSARFPEGSRSRNLPDGNFFLHPGCLRCHRCRPSAL